MNKKTEIILLVIIFAVFIFLRSIYFPLNLNFSADQATSSYDALKIYQQKRIQLLGPSTSINFEGRNIFNGSAIYYFQLIFLILGNFNPIPSSYFFMLFCSLGIFPLYFGIKWLINQKAALFVIILYTLLPYYIDYTRFLWNPNLQLSLIPVLIFLMGKFHLKRSKLTFFLLSVCSGILLQLHYQFILILLGLIIYYFFYQKLNVRFFFYFATGIIVGFLPIVLFEIRNNFYNLRTVILYIQNLQASLPGADSQSDYSHYFLSVSLFALIIFVSFIKKKINYLISCTLFIGLFLYSLSIYSQKPTHGFRMADHWNYLDEEKVNKIIETENLKNINIANLSYDTLSSVQKYLLYKDLNIDNLTDYRSNEFLYVINKDDKFMENPAYEVNTFKPSTIIHQWPVNPNFNLYLLQRSSIK